MENLRVNLANIKLKNPIIPASGTVAFGKELSRKFNLNVLGSLVIKSTTEKPRKGNKPPVVTETSAGWLNAIGLKNPGIKNVFLEKLPWLASHFPNLPIIGSVAGSKISEYINVAKQIIKAPNIALIEINVSCPNVKKGGALFGNDPELVEKLTRKIVKISNKPVFMKLTPNVTDIVSIAKAAEKGGADGLTMINTLTGMKINLKTKRPVLGNLSGGLSGRAIHPLAINMVYQVRQHTKLPIIACGGVNNSNDVLEFFMAGANAIEIGSGNFSNPKICSNIINKLPLTMKKYKIKSLSQLSNNVLEQIYQK